MRSIIKSFAWFFVCVLITVFGICSGQATASADNTITAVRLGKIDLQGNSALRLVIETEKPLAAKLLLLDEPWRFVVDSAGLSWNVPGLPASGQFSDGLVIAYRFGKPKAGLGRLVLEMNAPASPERVFALPPYESGGNRLVIDLLDKGLKRFKLAQEALRTDGYAAIEPNEARASHGASKSASLPVVQQSAVTNPTPRPASLERKWIVAIDAGHGGKDPGAIGHAGTKEKEITLAAAKQLAVDLIETGKVSARLIRSSDKFYRLRKRIEIARDMGADLFISLHADSAPRKAARGISIFTLSDTASDEEAAYIARQENKADLVGGPDLAGEDPAAANALLSMFQRETMNESSRLASAILSEIHDMPGGDKRGHRFAGFAVLKSPDVPSVLVEMGFLSNKEDEKNLNTERYRRELTQRLSKAIVSYLTSASP